MDLSEAQMLEFCVPQVLAAAGAMPDAGSLERELQWIAAAQERGYFLPDEEEVVRLRYLQYLGLRTTLAGVLEMSAASAGSHGNDWEKRLPSFVTAFSAACVLMRTTRFLIKIATDHSVLWKKLDEADTRNGLPRKSFTNLYRNTSSPDSLARFRRSVEFYRLHRSKIRALASDPRVGPLVDRIEQEEQGMMVGRRKSIRQYLAYRWFSLYRRQRSVWNQVMFGLFEAGGSIVADLRQPTLVPRLGEKRLTPEIRERLLPMLRPGDVFVTRHDDALSNLFLPGFWPHAALYLGDRGNGAGHPGGAFLESKKDGVRVRPLQETLSVDACVVLRSPLGPDELETALDRAIRHEGKLYDFLFDFRTSDRLACTEVIYRGFHGMGPIRFELRDVAGRKCLPAEELIDQALGCGFQIQAVAGYPGQGLLLGEAAAKAFLAARPAR